MSLLQLFHPTVCVFTDFMRNLFKFSLRSLNIFLIAVLESLSCASGILHFSGSTIVDYWVLYILSWLLMIVVLELCLGLYGWNE